MTRLTDDQHRARRDDVMLAKENHQGFLWLAGRWGVSNVAAWKWCENHATESECADLATFGKLRQGRTRANWDAPTLRLEDRLELLELCMSHGWTLSRLSGAIGLSQGALYGWVERNAPDGVAAALADYRDDEPQQAAA